MENLKLTDYLIAAAGIWFALLNFYLFKIIGQFRRQAKSAGQLDVNQVLDKRINQLEQEVTRLEQKNKLNFQKYALFRFNPFEETGGDQSFVAAFLDGQNNGIVISSLHARGGTRIYAKPVGAGKSTTYEFSKEEKEVVEKAARQTPQNG